MDGLEEEGTTFDSHMYSMLQRLVNYSSLLERVLELNLDNPLKEMAMPVLQATFSIRHMAHALRCMFTV